MARLFVLFLVLCSLTVCTSCIAVPVPVAVSYYTLNENITIYSPMLITYLKADLAAKKAANAPAEEISKLEVDIVAVELMSGLASDILKWTETNTDEDAYKAELKEVDDEAGRSAKLRQQVGSK